jgi:glycine cleavage system H lipoate-binding protein
MRCPFLRDEQVKSCQAAPFRKTLARSAAHGEAERCSSPDHASCPVARHSHEAHPSPSRCPFLQETLVQFCAATPLPAYVPWSSSPEVRCTHDGHRFCELFLAAAGSAARGPAQPPADPLEARVEVVAGVPMPGWLFYAENHTWLDPGDDGLWHLGVDAFLAQVMGVVERLAFLTVKGTVRPAVVLTVRGVDLTLVFPCTAPLVAANTRLRSSLDRLTADPYGRGWLFEVRSPAQGRGTKGAPPAHPPGPGLRSGAPARDWMAAEVQRVTDIVHARFVAARGERAADGGRFAPDMLQYLEREEILRLFADLFPIPDLRRTS